MKVHELLEAKTTIEDLIARLERVGGKVYADITKGDYVGKLGVNGKGRAKVYFAFYPDGTSQRFEHQPTKDDLKTGWKAKELRDPETVERDDVKAAAAKKAQDRENLYQERIQLSFKELTKVCREYGIHLGPIADAYVDGDQDQGTDLIGGKWVAWSQYTIITKNEDWREGDKEWNEHHDPVHVKIWRDAKDPEKLHAAQTDLG